MAGGGILRALKRLLGLGPARAAPAGIAPGTRVRLRTPLASHHTVWVPAGASGIVVGWDRPRRRVSIELDTPRTVVTVPWSWVESEGEPSPPAPPGPPARP